MLGLENALDLLKFEQPVHTAVSEHKGFIDVLIPSAKTIVEQKSYGKDLSKRDERQDRYVNAAQQALGYVGGMALSQKPRYIVACNFEEFWIYDTEVDPLCKGEPLKIKLSDLPSNLSAIQFLAGEGEAPDVIQRKVDVEAGRIMGKIHEAIAESFEAADFDRNDVNVHHAISSFCTRIMFIYSSKIKCGDCGSWYGSKTWHSTDKYRTRIWQCNHKFEEHCTTPHLKEDEIQMLFIKGVNMLVKDKQEIIVTHKEMVKTVFDTSSLENEQVKLEEELNIVADKVNNCINENARKLQDQDEYEKKYASLVNRFNTVESRLKEVKARIVEKQARRDEVEYFIDGLKKQDLLTAFDENVWLSMVDYLCVHKDGKVEFTFLDGSKTELKR